jgi:hypothetical protein
VDFFGWLRVLRIWVYELFPNLAKYERTYESCMCSLFEWSRAWGFTALLTVGGFLESLSQSL